MPKIMIAYARELIVNLISILFIISINLTKF